MICIRMKKRISLHVNLATDSSYSAVHIFYLTHTTFRVEKKLHKALSITEAAGLTVIYESLQVKKKKSTKTLL